VSLFVDKQRVPVYERDDLTSTDPAQNVVYIKSRMNWKETSTYKDMLFTMEASGLQPHIGAAEMAAMKINIVGWDGPSFCDERGVPLPCTPEQIEQMDPTEPFWQKVLGEINTRNRPRQTEATDTKKAIPSTGDGTEHSVVEVNSAGHAEVLTLRSPAQNGTTGRRIKSVN
jgi:hypothetical protein